MTYSVAFEQDIQVFCSFTVFVIIEGTLVNGVFTIRLWTITTIEAFLPQRLCNMKAKSKLEELFRMTKTRFCEGLVSYTAIKVFKIIYSIQHFDLTQVLIYL